MKGKKKRKPTSSWAHFSWASRLNTEPQSLGGQKQGSLGRWVYGVTHGYSLCEFCNNIGFYGRNIKRDPKLQKNGHLFLLL